LKQSSEEVEHANTVHAGKTMLVTGGSRGLGAAVALLAAQRGYEVCVNYANDASRANEVVATIRSGGGHATAVRADIGREDDVEALFRHVDAELGTLDVLVNNAGIAGPQSRVDALRLQDIQRMFETNVFGMLLCSREAIRRMSRVHGGKGGVIINFSSASSRLGGAGRNVYYSASKGAVNSMSVGMAREVAAEGIRVNVVSPGVIDTESQDRQRMKDIAPTLPMQRPGLPDEVARAVLWLASDEASYITGTVVDVSGGR
jgi:NAD(P)-dependent dehydrogenase (short-subunit alcohol dehydrogenase family)